MLRPRVFHSVRSQEVLYSFHLLKPFILAYYKIQIEELFTSSKILPNLWHNKGFSDQKCPVEPFQMLVC